MRMRNLDWQYCKRTGTRQCHGSVSVRNQNLKPAIGLCVLGLLLFCSNALADVVYRRGIMPPLEGQITKIDEDGITIEHGAGTPDFVRWDQVREVEMDHADPTLEKYKEDAANLWRARTRLERRDAAMAEPLFERLFERYRGHTSVTALMVAEGLLRCRLARGANDVSVIPALETARLRRSVPGATDVYATLPRVLDDQTALCTALPPVWVVSPSLIKLERDLGAYNAGTDTVVAGMATLYRRAAQRQLGLRVDETAAVTAANHPGVFLLRAIENLFLADESARSAAQQAAARDLIAMPDWAQAWLRYFLGESQLAGGTAAQRDAGMIQLVHLPARFGAIQPYLTGLALARLADLCETSGDSAAAASLRTELLTRFPHHPILSTIKRKIASGLAISLFQEPT